MPLIHHLSRWSVAVLGAALVLSGSVASSATPDAAPEVTPEAGVAASDGSPTSLALAIPITAPAGTTPLIAAEDLERYTEPTGELSRQLNAVIGRPVALGVDPRILASIRILGNTAPESAVDWLDRLEGASNETFSLAWADADVAALSQAGIDGVATPTSFQIDPALFPAAPGDDGAEQPSGSPSPSPSVSPPPSPPGPIVPTGEQLLDLPFTHAGIAWPRDDTVTAADLPVLADAAGTAIVLDSSNVSFSRDAIPASATIGAQQALVSNNDISALLREAASASNEAAWTAAIGQLTASLTAWGGGTSTVLATFDRELPSAANRIAATITALSTTPGIVLTTLDTTLEEPPVEVGVVEHPVAAERVEALRSAIATEPASAAFATVLDDPSLITADQRRRILVLASNAWAGDADWSAEVTRFVTGATELLTAVHVLESSTINLLSDTGDVPVTISNALPYPVTVSVHMIANTAVLDVLEDSVTVTIEPQSQARAAVPVQSIANGTALLVVSLTSPADVPIASPIYITTNVQAGWETAFTAIVAAVVLLIFIAGIVRTVTRRRRENRAGAERTTS